MRKILFLIQCYFLLSCSSKVDYSSGKLREDVNFNAEWIFSPDSLRVGIKDQWMNQELPGAFSVHIPHTWNVQRGLENYYGWGWYQKKFKLPDSWKNKLIRIRFNAINRDATIWLNGTKILERMGAGYTPFEVILNENVRFDTLNIITILVNNEYSNNAIPMNRSFDWPNDGGIIRDIRLIKTESPSINHLLITPVIEKNKKAKVNIRILLDTTYLKPPANIDVWYSISREAKINSEGNSKLNVKAGAAEFSVELTNVDLWRFDNPNLYTLKLAIGSDYRLSDHYNSTFGIREMFPAGASLTFNGEPVRLPGLEWMPGSDTIQGMGEDTISSYKMLRLIKNANAVLTRFHWQQDDKILDWCDKNGLLVQEELPLWSRPYPTDINDTVKEIIKRQTEEMIFNHYNHPSVIAWGIGNELQAYAPEIQNFLGDIRKMILETDSTRMINYVSNTLHTNPDNDATTAGDLMMWNDYTGLWYASGKKPFYDKDLPKVLTSIHDLNPEKCLIISEYGLCEPVFKGGDPERIRHMRYHTAVYDTTNYIGGVIYFCLNDYRTHIGEEGTGKSRERVHGITDINGNPKPSYDTLKILFSPIRNIQTRVLNNKILISGNNYHGLPSYSLIGYSARLIFNSGNYKEQVVSLPVIMPGEKFNMEFNLEGKGKYTLDFVTANQFLVREFYFDLKNQ